MSELTHGEFDQRPPERQTVDLSIHATALTREKVELWCENVRDIGHLAWEAEQLLKHDAALRAAITRLEADLAMRANSMPITVNELNLVKQLDALRATITQQASELAHKQRWIDNMREAWRNHGKETSLHEWNKRMKAAIDYPDHLPAED